jgi:peptide/nickel transport system ATP-binding protein
VPLLSVRDLRVTFATDDGPARAVDGVSFDVEAGESIAVVGESGSGKSVTALSLLRLIQSPGYIDPQSTVTFEGQDLMAATEPALRAVRGARIGMVFQEPMSALNPVYPVGRQIAEAVLVHTDASRDEAGRRAVEMLHAVGIAPPDVRARQYPHELSGGTQQRVMIAMALVLRPVLLIADEPTSSLDVTVQAQILDLLAELRQQIGMSLLLISHDLGVVANIATRVLVMYAGQVVEEAPVEELFTAPHHPYTAALLKAAPRLAARAAATDRLDVIPGVVPPATAWPTGCRFHDRCPFAWSRCMTEPPPLYGVGPGHGSRCHLAVEPSRRAASALTAVDRGA